MFQRLKKLPASLLWAALFSALILIWVATGEMKGGAGLAPEGEVAAAKVDTAAKDIAAERFTVRTAVFARREFAGQIIIRGRSFADQQVELRAETAGMIKSLPVAKGAQVKEGDVLCEIEDGARAASLLEAEAAVAQAEGDYQAAKQLEKRGHTAALRVLQNKAAMDRARAALAKARLDLERTKIRAPFAGYVDEQPAKPGSFLAIGGVCAHLVALAPLRVIGAVKERDIKLVQPGQTAKLRFITGEEVSGVVKFLSATAEAETRTFRVEVEIANPNGALRSGITADIFIPLPERPAMLLPPSILTLNDDGEVGVRAVNERREVEFHAVKILSERQEGIYIEALPAGVSLITVGQDFVKAGQKVEAVPDPKFGGNKPGS